MLLPYLLFLLFDSLHTEKPAHYKGAITNVKLTFDLRSDISRTNNKLFTLILKNFKKEIHKISQIERNLHVLFLVTQTTN